MLRHATMTLLAALVLSGAALANQIIVYRALVKSEPQGVARFFDAPERLLVRATFDTPLPSALIGLKLVRNGTSVLDKPFDLKGDTSKFDLRLRLPDDEAFQPGVYKFTITQGDQVLAETSFLVGKTLPSTPPAPRLYYGPLLPEGADPFAAPEAPAGVTLLPPPPKTDRIIIFRSLVNDQPDGVGEQFAPADALYARLRLDQPLADGRGHLKLTHDGEVMSEGDIELKEKTIFDIRLVTDVGFAPGRYVVTITSGDRVLGEGSFTVNEAAQ